MCKSEKNFIFCTCELSDTDNKNFWFLNRKDNSGSRWVGTLEAPSLLDISSPSVEISKEDIIHKIYKDLNLPGAFDFDYIPEVGDQIFIDWNGSNFSFEFIDGKFETHSIDEFYFPFPSMISLAQGKILKN